MRAVDQVGTVVRIDQPENHTCGYQVRWRNRPSKFFSLSKYGSWEAAHMAALRTANQVAAVEIRRILQGVVLRTSAGEAVPVEEYAERIEGLTALRRRGKHHQLETRR